MKRLLGISALALICSVPSAARAATLDFTGVGKVDIVSISGLVNVTAYAGELDWNWVGTPPAGFSQSLYTYCVDVLNDVADPQNGVTVRSTDDITPVTSPSSAAGAGAKIAWLINTYAANIHASGTNEQAAGLQVAIWETLYDSNLGGFNLGSGLFSVSASAGTLYWATNYLTSLYSTGGTGRTVWLDSPAGGYGQDQVTVPEPSTLALLMLAAGALFMFRRKSTTFATLA